MEMKLNLTEKEARFLMMVAEQQYEDANDNLGAATPIHIVEREEKIFVTSDDGDTFEWCGPCGLSKTKYFNTLNALTDAHNAETGESVPYYDDGEVDEYYGANEYFRHYGINACAGIQVKSYTPVAFFFLPQEAARYKEQCERESPGIYVVSSYGLGENNTGDMPVLCGLLRRMGNELNAAAGEPRYKQLVAAWKENNGTLTFNDEPFVDENRLNCLWYAGEVASISVGNVDVSVRCCGEVRAEYYLASDMECPTETVNGNGNTFFASLASRINNDEELKSLLFVGYMPTEEEVAERGLSRFVTLLNNNWIELFVSVDGVELADSVVCFSDNIFDAVKPEYVLSVISDLTR